MKVSECSFILLTIQLALSSASLRYEKLRFFFVLQSVRSSEKNHCHTCMSPPPFPQINIIDVQFKRFVRD